MIKERLKKKDSSSGSHLKHEHHPMFRQELGLGQKAADKIAKFGGSWTFIIIFFGLLIIWMAINSWVLLNKPFDPYPFILLNLCLSCLAAIQAPVILMSQSRAAKRDQARAEMDLEKDLRDLRIDQSSHEVLLKIQKDITELKKKVK